MAEDRWNNLEVWRLADESAYQISQSLDYLSVKDYAELEAGYDQLGKRLWTFYEKVKQSA